MTAAASSPLDRVRALPSGPLVREVAIRKDDLAKLIALADAARGYIAEHDAHESVKHTEKHRQYVRDAVDALLATSPEALACLRPCHRCGSDDRNLDAHFWCSTCYVQEKARAEAAEAEVKRLLRSKPEDALLAQVLKDRERAEAAEARVKALEAEVREESGFLDWLLLIITPWNFHARETGFPGITKRIDDRDARRSGRTGTP